MYMIIVNSNIPASVLTSIPTVFPIYSWESRLAVPLRVPLVGKPKDPDEKQEEQLKSSNEP